MSVDISQRASEKVDYELKGFDRDVESLKGDDMREINPTYLVMAYRMGQRKGYNYPVGIFYDKGLAIEAAKSHHNYRGGKYDHIIWKLYQGVEYDAEEAEIVWRTAYK